MTERRKFERQRFEKDEDKGFEKAIGIGKVVGGAIVGIGVIGIGIFSLVVKKDSTLLEKGLEMVTRKKL